MRELEVIESTTGIAPGAARAVIWLLMAATLLASSALAKRDIESLYEQAVQAYTTKYWMQADSLAEAALARVDSLESSDWTYQADRRPFQMTLFGDYVVIVTSDAEDRRPVSRIEFYDLNSRQLVKVHNQSPWGVHSLFASDRYLGIVLWRMGCLEYRVLYFTRHDVENGRLLIREGIEQFSRPVPLDANQFAVVERGPLGLVWTILDLGSGTAHEIHNFQSTDVFWSISDPAQAIRIHEARAYLADGETIYSYSASEHAKKAVADLPFTISESDRFVGDHFVAPRGDTLHVLSRDSAAGYYLRTIQLPFAVNLRDSPGRLAIDGSGQMLAYCSPDSLWMFQIAGNSVTRLTATRSCLQGAVTTSHAVFWKGDTLIHCGNTGMRIIWRNRLLHAVDADGLQAVYHGKTERLFTYDPPETFLAIDLGTFDTLWTREYWASQPKVFKHLNEQYLVVNHIDGTSLLETETGGEVHRENPVASREILLSDDASRVLLCGDSYLAVRVINEHRMYKGDLMALRAVCRWAQKDTVGAVAAAKRALAIGLNGNRQLSEPLLSIFTALGLKREALRLIGSLAVSSEDDTWRDRLHESGAVALTDPHHTDDFGFVVTERGILSVPIAASQALVSKGQGRTCFWLEPPDYEPEELELAFTGIGLVSEGVVFFTYRKDRVRNVLQWGALLLTYSGEFRDLGTLFESDVSEENLSRFLYPAFYGEEPQTTNTPDRALLNMWRCDGDRICLRYTIGLDLSGAGNNWCDTTTRNPIRVGSRYYAHTYIGSAITEVCEGTQADTLGLRPGDIPLSLGGQLVSNTVWINRIKEQFPLRTTLDLSVLRGRDTLHFAVLNGVIGYYWANIFRLVEIDPNTGDHLWEKELPTGFHIGGVNTSGELVYCNHDTLLFYDPVTDRQRRTVIPGAEDFFMVDRGPLTRTAGDIMLMFGPVDPELLAVDISRNTADSSRILWRQAYERGYRTESGYPGYIMSEDPSTLPMLLDDGTLLIHDVATGTVLARETLPFRDFGRSPQIMNGVFYGAAANRVFGWKLAYYHPPFPWRFVGYGALALLPLLIATVPLHRWRVRSLRRRQQQELEQHRLKSEVETAAGIQRRIVPGPSQLPHIDRFAVYGYNYQCREVGGDYFDVIPIADGRFGFVICDVAGKGMAAALLVATLQATFHALFQGGQNLLDIVHRANRIILHDTAPDQYASAFVGIVDSHDGRMETVNAGHQYPLLVRSSAEIEELAEGGLCLGMFEFASYHSQITRLSPADFIYLYTDGVCEALAPNGEEFGCRRLVGLLQSKAGQSPREVLSEIERTIRTWTNGGNKPGGFVHDDFTQLAIQRVR